MERTYGLTVGIWVEWVCPYLSLADMQVFRLCSKGCRSLIRQTLPLTLVLLETVKTDLESSPLYEEEITAFEANSANQKAAALQTAQSYLNSIDKASLDALRKMHSPPTAILETGKLINLILGYQVAENPFSKWDSEHISRLAHYDTSRIPRKTVAALGRYLDTWSEQEVTKAGKSCVGFYYFIKGLYLMSAPVSIETPPMRAEIERLERDIEVCRRLAEK